MTSSNPVWLKFPSPAPLAGESFLPPGAAPRTLVRAAAANHTAWFAAKSAARGGETLTTNGVTWSVGGGEATIPFPDVDPEQIGPAIDQILAECRARSVQTVSCWSLSGSKLPALAAAVTARGFEWGWQPHWMALDLHRMHSDFRVVDGLTVELDDVSDWQVYDLPYYDRNEMATLQALVGAQPRRVWHFAGQLEGKVVAHSLLLLTTGRLGIGGIYNVGVVPAARGQGIGSAISYAACCFAAELGCHHALLNSAANALYEGLGFRSLGHGQSWWMHRHQLTATPAPPDQIAFVEALILQDIPALNGLAGRLPDLDAALPNGMTPMKLVVSARKPKSALWLAARGAALGVIDAWGLGWRSRAAQLLAKNPEAANRRSGPWRTTPVHDAVSDDDRDLVRLLLTANPDLSIQDSQFHGTPLGWAKHLNRPEIVKLLEAHLASGNTSSGSS